MKRKAYIVFFALGFMGCAATANVPIDDAYHWSDKTDTQTTQPTDTTQTKESAPALEYINVQDTTVTVRIHR